MNDKDEFLARWMRLKQEAGAAKPSAAPPLPRKDVDGRASAPNSLEPTFDSASLPAIETLTGASDIRQFLESGVPAELMHAALRRAWAADPEIRDFIGIAESQWDFNDPKAMPGFGPLSAMENAESVVTHSVGGLKNAVEPLLRLAEVTGPQRDGQVDKVWLSSGMTNKNPTSVAAAQVPPITGAVADSAADSPSELRRTHGSALPKFT